MRQITFVMASFLVMAGAHAASFDCSKAKSKVEQTICSDPEISSLDDQLAASYGAALKSLSPEGGQVLKKGQVAWLRYVNIVCSDAECLAGMYRDRLKDLDTAAVRIGPFVFSRIDYFSGKKGKDSGTSPYEPYQEHQSYPRIDSPMSDMARQWNALVAKTPKAGGDNVCDGDSGEHTVSFEIKLATADIISVQRGEYDFCQGNAHPNGTVTGATYMLAPEPHLMKAAELFDQKKPWKKFVTDKCVKALKEHAEGELETDEGTVKGIATNPKAWSLTKEGLLITFNPYEVLPYAYGDTEVLIPWSELRPFLVSSAPIPKP